MVSRKDCFDDIAGRTGKSRGDVQDALDEILNRAEGYESEGMARDSAFARARDELLQAQAEQQNFDGRKRNFALAAGKLHALSPLAVLQRGYAIARLPDGTVVTDAAQAQPGDTLEVKLLRGRLDCRVQSTEREGADE